MVRTRADNTARKAVAAKAPRKNYNAAAGPSATSPTSAAKANKNAGGNPYCPRPTPDWQKEITNFFIKTPRADKENEDPEDEASGAGGMVTENTEDVPTSSKTADKRKIKKSKDTSPDQSEAATSSKDTSVEQSEAATSSKDAPEDKMDEDDDVAPTTSKQQDSEPMEVEIKIVDKKEDKNTEPEKDKESPRPFQKNNCISDSDEDD